MINKKEILKENQIGVRLEKLIKSRNETINLFIDELATRSKIDEIPSYEEFLAYIKGRRKPKIKLLLAICNSFNVSLQSFLMN